MNHPDNLASIVINIENLMVYMAQTQNQVSANQQLLTAVVQTQEEEINLMRQMLKNYDETIVVMQGQIGLLLNKLLGNS